MKQLLIGFLLGMAVCVFMDAELYHPSRRIITRSETNFRPDISADFKAVMMNQEAIFNLIKNQCGTK